MLEFREIQISDKERITAALRASDFRGCEYSFANNMAWRRLADSKITFFKDFYISCAFDTSDRIPAFTFPSGKGDLSELIAEMRKYTDSLGKPLKITGLTESSLEWFKETYGESFSYSFDRDDSDYIYNSVDLIELAGKKYHGKRNHLARFNELNYEYSSITEKDFDDCITFSVLAYNEKSSQNDHSFVAEQYAIHTFFNYFEQFGLSGGIIRINGKIAAFTIGEGINSDTFCVHIEKADTQYSGIYAGINNLFARSAASGYKYINREEDLGIEGLRKSKLSYRPAFLLDKYTVIFK